MLVYVYKTQPHSQNSIIQLMSIYSKIWAHSQTYNNAHVYGREWCHSQTNIHNGRIEPHSHTCMCG